MGFSVGKFVGNLVGILVGVVLTGALLTVFATVEVPETISNSAAIETLIGVLPLVAVIGLLLAGIYMFISRK